MGLTNPQSADHIAAEDGSFEPQRQDNFSFEVALGDADKDLIIMSLETAALPTESNEEVEVHYQNERRYVAGKFNVESLALSFKDFVDVDVRGALLRWRKQVYDPHTGKVGLAKDYKKTGYIVMTAPDGTSSRVCRLEGCWPQTLNGGQLDMKTADPVMIELTLRYDKPIWETPEI